MPIRVHIFASLLVAPFLVSLLHAQGAELPQRTLESIAAMEQFKNTHNFTDGRGIHVVPGIYNFLELLQSRYIPVNLLGYVRDQMGFNLVGREAIGLFGVKYEGMKVGVLGCVACHSGKAAGQLYIGLGNKRIDAGLVGKQVQRVSKPYQWTRHLRPAKQRQLIDQAMKFTGKLADPKNVNETQGLVPARLISTWFYDVAGIPIPDEYPKGQAKVPHFWGLAEKEKVGLFCDAMGDAHPSYLWVATNELTAGQTPETIRANQHLFENIANMLRKFLPPKYPFEIDQDLAAHGETIFKNRCASCHGTYEKDVDGLPIYKQPRVIPWAAVKTDRDRLDAAAPEFRAVAQQSPLGDLIRFTEHTGGYVSPRLDGIWARFPYLHNASVPTIWHLLMPAAQRPIAWSLADAGEAHRFDKATLGLTMPEPGSRDEARIVKKAQGGARDHYSVDRLGCSNVGHEFGTDLPVEDKQALVEYLKTL